MGGSRVGFATVNNDAGHSNDHDAPLSPHVYDSAYEKVLDIMAGVAVQ